MRKSKLKLLIVGLFLSFSVWGQKREFSMYHKACSVMQKNRSTGKDALDVLAKNFLESGQIFVYLHLESSDTLTTFLNDSLIHEKVVNVLIDKTGDIPDYSFKIKPNKKINSLTIYFKKDSSYVTIPIDRLYRIYQVSYWQNCLYITKKKYYRFS